MKLNKDIQQIRKALKKPGMLCTLGVALLFVLSGCINDNMIDCPGQGTGGGEYIVNPEYYIEVNIDVPTDLTTRAEGDPEEGGEESGSGSSPVVLEAENEVKVEKVALYFLRADNSTENGVTLSNRDEVLFSLTTDVSGITQDSQDVNKYKAKVKVDENGFEGLKELAGKRVNLLVVCNPHTIEYTLNEGDEAGTATFNVDGSPVGLFDYDTTDDKYEGAGMGKVLPMANAGNYILQGEGSFENINADSKEIIQAIKNLFTLDGTEMIKDLGSLSVERAVARFDIQDGPSSAYHTDDWTYRVAGNTEIYLKMHSVTPFNINKDSYVARHVAEGTTEEATEDWVFLDKHDVSIINKWMADPTWRDSDVTTGKYTKAEFNNNNALNWLQVIDEETGKFDFFEDYDGVYSYTTEIDDLVKSGVIDGYYPWCYMTENTIPAANLWNEENRVKTATGVAFKFMVMEKDGKKGLTKNSESDKIPVNVDFNDDDTIRITDGEGNYVVVAPEDGNYYVTYFGFITHKSKTVTNTPMEYSVVRNTVYQMKISQIGHLPQPEEPDSYFLSLDIKILAWAKRDIEVTF